MGSTSDLESMQGAIDVLEELGIPFEKKVVSAHRTPDLMYEYAKTAALVEKELARIKVARKHRTKHEIKID